MTQTGQRWSGGPLVAARAAASAARHAWRSTRRTSGGCSTSTASRTGAASPMTPFLDLVFVRIRDQLRLAVLQGEAAGQWLLAGFAVWPRWPGVLAGARRLRPAGAISLGLIIGGAHQQRHRPRSPWRRGRFFLPACLGLLLVRVQYRRRGHCCRGCGLLYDSSHANCNVASKPRSSHGRMGSQACSAYAWERLGGRAELQRRECVPGGPAALAGLGGCVPSTASSSTARSSMLWACRQARSVPRAQDGAAFPDSFCHRTPTGCLSPGSAPSPRSRPAELAEGPRCPEGRDAPRRPNASRPNSAATATGKRRP